MTKNTAIICFGFAEWDNPYRTNQHHIMERFARENRVLFIESLGLRQPVLQKKDVSRILKRLVKWVRGVRRVNKNIYVISPMVIPFHKYAFVRILNKLLLNLQLDWAVWRYGFKRPIIWSYIPNAVEYLGRWNEVISVYHCVDELSANPRIPKDVVQKLEKEFLAKVSVVFTTAKALYESKRPFNKNTYYLPNVADFDHFNKALSETTPIPEEIAISPSPRIGFIGAISNYKLDFELIADIATQYPRCSFIFVGSKGEGEKAADISLLERIPNVHFLGGKPYSSLPAFLKGFDVCLLPNRLNEYTKNMFPMKFFEYLAAGKPVVSTRLDAISEFGEYCYLSSDHKEFIANIEKALNENNSNLRAPRIALAQQYTWENRIKEMKSILGQKL